MSSISSIEGVLSEMRAAAARAGGQFSSSGAAAARPSGGRLSLGSGEPADAAQGAGGVLAGTATGASSGTAAAGGDFMTALKASLDQVNSSQMKAAQLGKDFELGVGKVDLNDVMIGMQKANISFQAAVQVRSRLVSAYHDIMNLQI